MIDCDNNCYHMINLKLRNLTHTNPDPCNTRLRVTPGQAGPGNYTDL
jgi:hypothetical protein